MLPLPDHNPSRHARMFELLRQKELAKLTAQRLKDEARFEGYANAEKQLKKDALASFNPPTLQAQRAQASLSGF